MNSQFELEKKYNDLFESMFSGFAIHEIITDESGKPVDYRFLEVNTSFEQITGLQAKDIIGNTILEILPNTEQSWIEIYGEVALKGKKVKFEQYARELDKHFKVVAYKNHLRQFTTVFQDISDRKRYEESILQAKNIAESANLVKSEFLSTISHELKTPLNAILGMAEVVIDTDLDSNQKHFMNVLFRSGEHMLSLVEEILDMAQIEAGTSQIEYRFVELRKFIQHSLDFKEKKARDKGLVIVCQIDHTLPDMLLCDPKRLRQILLILVDNAIKFTDSGTIVIHISKLDSNRINFSVKDTGVGISKEDQNKIFEIFTQVDSSLTRKVGGLGLGLTLCKRFIDLLGGTITVESELGIGSTFSFFLPLDSLK